jgi:hypothetical protein
MIMRPEDKARAVFFPETKAPPPPGTFEFGLVLGGTVSAGAYTAGALDFLVQALDAWHEQKDGPPHIVLLKTAAGSSGGAVCAAILGALTNRDFTHVTNQPASSLTTIDNKLWNVWVETFNFKDLVDTSDISEEVVDEQTGSKSDNTQHVISLFNSRMIDDAVRVVVTYAMLPGNKERAWVAKPFRIAVTVGNLRGIPYKIQGLPVDGTFTGASFVQHDDYAWFAIPSWKGTDGSDKLAALKRPDEFWLSANPQPGASAPYEVLGEWAAASGALPLGLKARVLSQPIEHYNNRPRIRLVKTNGAIETRIDWPTPDWTEIPEIHTGEDYQFSAVDGGTFNNDPVRLVHTALAGLIGENPRDPQEANRAMLMIDPLAEEPHALERTGRSLSAIAKSIVGAVVAGARYLTADMELFAREDVFSRFQLVPTRKVEGEPRAGADALAGTGLFAAAGWCAREFRVHDFLLGRANMMQYLQQKFILRDNNKLFSGWSDVLRVKYAMDKDGNPLGLTPADLKMKVPKAREYFLPVIPVLPELQAEVPEWPNGALSPGAIEQPLRNRLETVLRRLREDNLPGIGPWILNLVTGPTLAANIASGVVDSFDEELRKAGLWPRGGDHPKS